jgi:hypothetical protein
MHAIREKAAENFEQGPDWIRPGALSVRLVPQTPAHQLLERIQLLNRNMPAIEFAPNTPLSNVLDTFRQQFSEAPLHAAFSPGPNPLMLLLLSQRGARHQAGYGLPCCQRFSPTNPPAHVTISDLLTGRLNGHFPVTNK